MKVKLYDIQWDVDYDANGDYLPTTIVENFESSFDVENEGGDFLSNNFGFCVHGFRFEILEE